MSDFILILIISISCGLVFFSSLWPSHSSQDQVQSSVKLVFLQKAKTMRITRPPVSSAKQVLQTTDQEVL